MEKMKRPLQIGFLVFWVLITITALFFRSWQLFHAIDFATGFYNNWDFSLFWFDVVLVVAAIGVLAFSLLLRNQPFQAAFTHNRTLSCICGLLCAIGISLTGVFAFVQTPISEFTILQYLSIFMSIPAIAAFVAYAYRAVQLGKHTMRLWQCGVVTIWGCVELFRVFIDESYRSNTSEYVLIVIAFCLLTLFFLKLGRQCLKTRGETPNVSFLVLFSSALGSVFGLMVSISNLIAIFSGLGTIYDFFPSTVALLPLSLFAAGFFITNGVRRKKHPSFSNLFSAETE